MLTRRQARLQSLTTGDAASSPSLTSSSSQADVPRVLKNEHATSRTSAAGASGSHVLQLNMTVTPLSRTVWDGTNSNTAATLSAVLAARSAGRIRVCDRQLAETMAAAAQGAVDYWSGQGSTKSTVLRITPPLLRHVGTHAPLTRQSEKEHRLMLHLSTDGDGSPEQVNAGKANGESSAVVEDESAQRMRRRKISAAPLRASWRAVTRSCTTIQLAPARSSGTAPVATRTPTASAPPLVLRLRPVGDRSASAAMGDAGQDAHERTVTLPVEEGEEVQEEMEAPLPVTSILREALQQSCTATTTDAARRDAAFFVPPFHCDGRRESSAVPPPILILPQHQTTPSTTSFSSTAPRISVMALRGRKIAQCAAQQRRLTEEVYYQVFVRAHESRMRLLFGLAESDRPTDEPAVDQRRAQTEAEGAVRAGEEAYLASLDTNGSPEQAKVVEVITAVDAALRRHLATAYNSKTGGGGAGPLTLLPTHPSKEGLELVGEEESEGRRWRRGENGLRLPVRVHAPSSSREHTPSSSPSATHVFAARRPLVMEAVLDAATHAVESFTAQLLPYQQEGVRWLLRLNAAEHTNGILADDMGLGKTAQTVTYLACYKEMVESVVQDPLRRLQARHRQLCQQALRLLPPSSNSRGPAAVWGGEEGEAGTWELPPWLGWCVHAGMKAEVEGEDNREEEEGEESSSSTSGGQTPPPFNSETETELCRDKWTGSDTGKTKTSPELLSAQACGNTVRLVKAVKHWLWQMEETRCDGSGGDAAPSSPCYGAVSSSSCGSSILMAAPTDRAASGSVSASSVRTAASDAAQLLTLASMKRRPGRPPTHLRAVRAAAAAAGTYLEGMDMRAFTASPGFQLLSPTSTPLFHSSPKELLANVVRQQTRLRGCSAAVNDELELTLTRFRPVLVIAPLSTLPHWATEFSRFTRRRAGTGRNVVAGPAGDSGAKAKGHTLDRFTVYVLNGPRVDREARMRSFLADIDDLDKNDSIDGGLSPATPVLVIPHDLLTKPVNGPLRQITRVRWHVVVVDEAQRIKSARSTLFQRVCQLKSVSRLVLTGTPLQNNAAELFPLLHFLSPSSFSTTASSDLFRQLDTALMAATRSSALESRELHLLLCRRVHELLAPFILRREKSILQSALPPIRDYAVLCPLLPYQAEQLAIVRQKHEEGTLSGNPHIQYRKILLHPYTTQAFFYVDEGVVLHSGKLLVLDFMMRFLQRTRHKFLVFCAWTLVLDVVETLCGMRQIPYVRLDGKTSVEQREANIKEFSQPDSNALGTAGEQNREGMMMREEGEDRGGGSRPRRATIGARASADTPDAPPSPDSGIPESPNVAPCCFLISKVAGGVGLNLQAADTVFLLDVEYNPQRDAQALSRVYRVGQTREVRVFRLIIDHPIERGVVSIHEAKASLGHAVVQAGRYDLHSTVQEREEALQQTFCAGALSQLSQQWTSTGAAPKADRGIAATVGDDDDVSSPLMEKDDGEEEKLKDREDKGTVEEDALGAWEGETLARTPTDFPRMQMTMMTTEAASFPGGRHDTPAFDDERVKVGTEDGHQKMVTACPVLPDNDTSRVIAARQPRLPSSSGSSSSTASHSSPSQRRRRISFQLTPSSSESANASRCLTSSSNGSRKDEAEEELNVKRGKKDSVLYAADDAANAATTAPLVRASQAAAVAPAAVPSAAHLLAMRERLEEVLLRHDGEQAVLQDMFCVLESSLAPA